MGDQAKENLNVENGALWSALNKMKNDFELGKSKLSSKEVQEAAKKADELKELEKKFDNTADKKTNVSMNQNTNTQRKIWMERAKNHNDNVANIERAVAWWNIAQDLQKPEKWPAKRLQGVVKRVLGTKNIQ